MNREDPLGPSNIENKVFTSDENVPDRVTLADQMNESNRLQELEYRKQLEARNSSYKLDDKSAKFYNELKISELEKERLTKEIEKQEVTRFKLKQINDQKIGKKPTVDQNTPKKIIKKKPSLLPSKSKKSDDIHLKALNSEAQEHLKKSDKAPQVTQTKSETPKYSLATLNYSSDSDD